MPTCSSEWLKKTRRVGKERRYGAEVGMIMKKPLVIDRLKLSL